MPAPPCVQALLFAARCCDLFAGAGDRVDLPEDLAGFRVERGQAPADPVLAAGTADVEFAVVESGARGDREALARLDHRRRPVDLAGLLVERDLVAVQLRDVDHAVADRDAAVVPTTADDFAERIGRQVRVVFPEDFAGAGVHREDVVGAVGGVDRAFVLERLALGGELRRGGFFADFGDPVAFQFLDVFGVDFVKAGEAVVGELPPLVIQFAPASSFSSSDVNSGAAAMPPSSSSASAVSVSAGSGSSAVVVELVVVVPPLPPQPAMTAAPSKARRETRTNPLRHPLPVKIFLLLLETLLLRRLSGEPPSQATI